MYQEKTHVCKFYATQISEFWKRRKSKERILLLKRLRISHPVPGQDMNDIPLSGVSTGQIKSKHKGSQ